MDVIFKAAKLLRICLRSSEVMHLKKSDFLLVCHDANRSYEFQGNAYSPILGSIGHLLAKNGFSIQNVSRPWSNLVRSLNRIGPVNVDREVAIYLFLSKISSFFAWRRPKNPWITVLAIVQPRFVFAIQPPPELCAASRLANIRIVDVQHGVIENSIYYNYELTHDFGLAGLPNACLCWDESSVGELKKILPEIDGILLGNPWISRFVKPQLDDQLVLSARRQIKLISTKKFKLIITLQWDPHSPRQVILPRGLTHQLKKLISLDWALWIRFHPVQLKEVGMNELTKRWFAETQMMFDQISVVNVTDLPLPLLFLESDFHLTGRSASAIEASLMGLKTVLWQNSAQTRTEFKAYLEKDEMYFSAEGQKGLASWINAKASKQIPGQPKKTPSFDEIEKRIIQLF